MTNLGKKLATLVLAGAVAAFGLAGCQDLDVENPNAPDRERALATASDIVSLISSSYTNYIIQAQSYWPGMALSVGADHHTSPWGNFAMLDFGSEPRTEWNNNNTYAYAITTERPWFMLYGAAVSASNGLRAIDEGVQVSNEAQVRAFGKFVQGLSHGFIALIFDQGYIVDETVDPAAEQGFQPYTAVMDAALGYLEEAASIAESNSFTLPESWLDASVDSDRLARIARSYKARFRASVPRSASEAQQVDWGAVRSDIAAGIQQDLVHTSDGNDAFWSGIKSLGADWVDIWARVDYKQIGPADVSGEWESWVNTPVADRNMFDIESPDQRLPATNAQGERGLYFNYQASIAYPPSRGTYHFSHYGDHRYEEYAFSCTFCWFGSFPEMTMTEMRLLEAEAWIMDGQPANAVPLINETRVGNGGLPAVTVDGVPESADCVPQGMNPDDVPGSGSAPCGDLLDALAYEKGVEVFQVSAGIPFWDDRRWGLLETGSPVHWPVPGQELENLQMDIYTYGGGGENSAPTIVPGDKESILQRISYDLEMLEKQQQQAMDDMAAVSIDP